MPIPLTIKEVGRLCNVVLPEVGKRTYCPFRSHKNQAKHFAVFVGSNDGCEMFVCFACDPPGNVGDAVGLYAVFRGVERKRAWKDLLDAGYAVPGADRYPEHGGRLPPAPVRAHGGIPVLGLEGRLPQTVLDMSWPLYVSWTELREGFVERYAAERSLDASLLRTLGVVDMPIPGGAVGFVYTDPDTGYPCRVKVRCLGSKKFWVEPRPTEAEPTAKSLGPLYLANVTPLSAPGLVSGTMTLPWATIVEGEVDALTLRQMGISGAVSLPDGAGSAAHCDLRPLCPAFPVWLIATDDDEAGNRAHQALTDRARIVGVQTVRVLWRRIEGDGDAAEVVHYKDANDALRGITSGGGKSVPFDKTDFLMCIAAALDTVGLKLPGWDR